MGRLILSLICSILVSLPASARWQPQAAGASANREVKVHIEGKDVDALELLQQLNARGTKKHLNFLEAKEGFDYKIKVETIETTHMLQHGYVGANAAVENDKGQTLFFFRGSSRFTAKRALDEAAQETIKKLEPYLKEKSR